MLWSFIMNVATRITVATAVVVALASAGYAIVDLRARRTERMQQLTREEIDTRFEQFRELTHLD